MVAVTGPLCPMTKDGRHKLKPFGPHGKDRGGLACERCHKTWGWVGDDLVATYPEQQP